MKKCNCWHLELRATQLKPVIEKYCWTEKLVSLVSHPRVPKLLKQMTHQHKAGKLELVPHLVIFTAKYVETTNKSPNYFQILCKSLLVSEKPTWANSVNTGFIIQIDGRQSMTQDSKYYGTLYKHQRNQTALALVLSAVAQCQSLTPCVKQKTQWITAIICQEWLC